MKRKLGRYGEHFHSAHVAKKIAPHDVLGRAVLAVSQTRHLGTANKGFSGVCTAYDAASRPVRVSEPFFLTSIASANEPTSFAGTVCTSARSWNTTSYDALGRIIQVQRADGTGNTQSYSGLTTTTWDANSHASSQSVNALGEVVTSTDGAGLALSFTYRADGQIATVSRNAGRGAVDTSYVYDVLGRKLSQTERDTGTTSYQYNAIGEVIVQTDSANHRIERHLDARGRLWRERSYRWGGGGHSLESTRQFVFDTLARGAHPTDSRLLEIARHHVVKAAKAAGIRLKQTFASEGKTRRRKAGGYAHARQFKRLRKAVYIDVVIVFPPTFVVASELDVAGTFRRLNMDFQSGEYATVLAPQRIPPSRLR